MKIDDVEKVEITFSLLTCQGLESLLPCSITADHERWPGRADHNRARHAWHGRRSQFVKKRRIIIFCREYSQLMSPCLQMSCGAKCRAVMPSGSTVCFPCAAQTCRFIQPLHSELRLRKRIKIQLVFSPWAGASMAILLPTGVTQQMWARVDMARCAPVMRATTRTKKRRIYLWCRLTAAAAASLA